MNKYDIQKVVGQGSYGRAILCKRKNDSKLCIIKQISLGKLSRHEAKMTEQEAALLHKLQHPNIVAFWESFVANSNLHIVMEYADGGDLENYIKSYMRTARGREMPEAQVLNIFVQLCLAIKHIHDRKILHRDLKCQNVFMTSSGICKLGDFGVSRVLRSTAELAATQIGTPYYMSPEIMNNQKYNSKTDIWSLGIILYELVCLRLPFQGNSMKQLCYNIINASPAPPSTSFSKDMRDLVRDILAKDPRKRPSVNNVLARPIIKDRIKNFLNETKIQREFCHTILHGVDVLKSIPQQPPPSIPISRPSVAAPSNAGPPHVAAPLQQNARPHVGAPQHLMRVPVGAAPYQTPAVRAAIPAPSRPAAPVSQPKQPPPPVAAPPIYRSAQPPIPLERQHSQNEVKPALNRIPSAPVVNTPHSAAPPKDGQPQTQPPQVVPADKRIPQDAPKKVQEIIANMLKPPVVMANKPPPRVAAPADYVARKEVVKVPVPSSFDKRPDSAPSRSPMVREPIRVAAKAPVPVFRKQEEKLDINNPFEAVVGKAIRPQSANSRPSSANQGSAQPVVPKEYKDAPPLMAKRNLALQAPPSRFVSEANEKKVNHVVDRMKGLDDAMGKAAAVMNLVKQEKERMIEKRSPVPLQPNHVVARRASDPPKPFAVESPIIDKPWLFNLENQMGALKVQMQQIKNAKTPQSSDQGRASPSGFAVGNNGDPESLRKRAAAIIAMRNNKESEQTHGFPVGVNNIDLEKAKLAKISEPSQAAVAKLKPKISPVPGPRNKAGIVNRRQSDPIPQNHVLKVKVSDPKVVVKPKVTPTPDSKEALEQRKELRERHRSDFRKFLQQQKIGKNSISEGAADDEFTVDEDSITTEAPTPRVNIVDPHTHLTPEASQDRITSEGGNHNGDRRRKSGGLQQPKLNIVSDESKALHDEERDELRRLIQEKRRQTPQQGPTEPEVLVLVNKNYDSSIHSLKPDFTSPPPASSSEIEKKQGFVIRNQHSGDISDPWTDNFRATASPISRRKISMELEDDMELEPPLPTSSEYEKHDDCTADNPVSSWVDPVDGFLGQSFITELSQNPSLIDPQAALEYSMMLDQMQQILQLPTKLNAGDVERLDQIMEGAEDEIEEGFEEESIKFEISDEEDEFRDSNDHLEDGGEIEIVQPNEEFGFDENDDLLLADSDLYITENDPFGNTLADLTISMKNEVDQDRGSELKYLEELQSRLVSILGKQKYFAAIEFLSSTLLVDEATDDDQLLSMLEEIIGSENLQYLEDLYQIVSYQNS